MMKTSKDEVCVICKADISSRFDGNYLACLGNDHGYSKQMNTYYSEFYRLMFSRKQFIINYLESNKVKFTKSAHWIIIDFHSEEDLNMFTKTIDTISEMIKNFELIS